jgi:hypothetical protein
MPKPNTLQLIFADFDPETEEMHYEYYDIDIMADMDSYIRACTCYLPRCVRKFVGFTQ